VCDFRVPRVAAGVNRSGTHSATHDVAGRAHVRRVCETLDPRVPALVHTGWAAELPWVVQGTTTRGSGRAPFDLGLFSDGSPADAVRASWDRLIGATGMRTAVHARQVHGAEVRKHDLANAGSATGLRLSPECDGHVTSEPGVLLAVSAADCVPIFVVDPPSRTVAALHAGWRGVAASVLERGLAAVAAPGDRSELRVHLGPSICGSCYEVGPEVFAAVGLEAPERPTPIDLRGVLARRAIGHGVAPEHVTISEHCTLCTSSGLFSHRGGDRGRQVGYVGIRV
jgi:YfiH family protein